MGDVITSMGLRDLWSYIGIPFRQHGRDADGCDCWGLVYMVHRALLGNPLASYVGSYDHTNDCAAIGEAMLDGKQAWQRVVMKDWQMLDVVLFRRGGHVAHCGLMVDTGLMLHSTRDHGSHLTRITTGQWAPRLEGLYRYVD